MKLLCIETSTAACSVALAISGKIEQRYEVAAQQHVEIILPMVADLLAQSQLSLGSLDALVFGQGPGSFTGVRIAASITQGLAFGADLPMIGVSSLRAMAQGAHRVFKADKVWVVMDARMQEVYEGYYQIDESGIMQSIQPDKLLSVDAISEERLLHAMGEQLCDGWVDATEWINSSRTALSAKPENQEHEAETQSFIYWVGNGCQLLKDYSLSTPLIQKVFYEYPQAQDLALIGQQAFQNHQFITAEQVQPIYLRNPL